MESKTTQSTNFLITFYRKFISKRIANSVAAFLTVWLTLAMSSSGWAQTVTTDKADYAPGETVQITGSGFLPGEYVSLLIIHIDPNFIYHTHADMDDALVDANGNFSSTWFVLDEELNTTLFLTAVGLTSELYAETMFTDAAPAPTISTIVPSSGTYLGGTNVTINGSGFGNPIALTFGGVSATNINRASNNVVTATTPANAIGFVNVVLTADGQSVTKTNGFEYTGCIAPTISAINIGSVNNINNTCGALVTLGTNLTLISGSAPVIYAYSLTNFGATISNPYTFPVGTTTVYVKATNSCGNDIKSFTVTVADNQAPGATAKNITVQLDANGAATIVAADINDGSSDNCAIDTMTLDIDTFACTNVGTPVEVTLTVNDVNGNSSTAKAFVTVEDNVAPVITCKSSTSKYVDPYATFYTISGTEFDATATDACDVASLTYKINGGAASANGASLNGVTLNVGTHSIVWTAIDVNNNSSTCTTTITVTKRTTTLTYTGDVTEQYSDVTNLSATLLDISGGLPGVGVNGKTISFKIGTQPAVTGTTDANGVATATLKLTQDPTASYTVKAEFVEDGSYLGDTDEKVFDITQENALVEYTGPEFVGEQNATASTTPVLLSASINDTIDGLGLDGDIRNARVQFYDINSGAILSGSVWLTPGLVTPGDLTKGMVTFSWNAPLLNTGYNSTTVGIRVGTQSPEANGYYVGSGQTVINVYRVSLNEFITGGGHIIPLDSKGEYASDAGRKVNFGFNVKWNKSVKNLQGNLNLIFRKGGKVYQIKATAMTSLSIISTNPCSQKATFISKANLTDVTNSALPISLYGGITLQVTMTDNGEPGKTDMIGFTLMNGNTLVYSSSWPVNKTAEMFLNGGNLVVHNGVKCTVVGTTTTALTSTKNPSNVGDLVTFKATVTGAVIVPTGSITFSDGSTVLATVPMIGGTASYSTSTLVLGDHLINALYNGDTKFKSSLGSLTQKVEAAPVARTSAPVITKQVKEEPAEIKLFNVTAYPNPSADYFTLKLQAIQSEEFNKVEVNVFDVLGRQVYRAQGNKEDSYEFGQNFQVGVYLVTVKQGNNTASLKVIKK